MANNANLCPTLTFKSWLSNGTPNAFGTVNTYQAGTVTPATTYTDATAGTPNANPIILNARGEANIFLLPNVGYKLVEADSFGNSIKTSDNVVNNQLITLYGGVDTGSTNAYIINFVANFSAYTDGIVIYWIPSHSNTGPSTINVNGLGAVNLLNQGGSALTSQQIFANQICVIMYKGGSFSLISSGQASAASSTLFLATRSVGAGSQTIASNTKTAIIFDSASVNRGTGYNTSTGLFTTSIAGIYTFTATLQIAWAGGNGITPIPSAFLSKNNTYSIGNFWAFTGQLLGALTTALSTTAASNGIYSATANFSMNAGDTMQVTVQTGNPGAGYTAIGDGVSCQFSGYQSG